MCPASVMQFVVALDLQLGARAKPFEVQLRVVANGSRYLHIKWTESGMCSLEHSRQVRARDCLLAGAAQACVQVPLGVTDGRGVEGTPAPSCVVKLNVCGLGGL
jgi:hypothetical protein